MKKFSEKLIDSIGEENFLKAESYYYSQNGTVAENLNFVDFVDMFKSQSINFAFPWDETEEGPIFWAIVDIKASLVLL